MRGKQMTEVKILYEDKDIIVVVSQPGWLLRKNGRWMWIWSAG